MRSVEVKVTTLSGKEFAFKDTSSTPNAGSTALTQIGADEMIHSTEAENGEMYIPFHAVKIAAVAYNDETVNTHDDLCDGDLCEGLTFYYRLSDTAEDIELKSGASIEITKGEQLEIWCGGPYNDGQQRIDQKVMLTTSNEAVAQVGPDEVVESGIWWVLTYNTTTSGTATITVTAENGCSFSFDVTVTV